MFRKNRNKKVMPIKDAYTYFVTSICAEHLKVQKLHLCYWRFRKHIMPRKELLEVGMQIAITDECSLEKTPDGNRALNISVLIPWLVAGSKAVDMYKAIHDTRNARFIFNEDVEPGDTFDKGEGDNGQVLKFKEPLVVLPCVPKTDDGKLALRVDIPKKVGLSKMPIYIRVGIEIKNGGFCYANNGISKSMYSYDVKVNEPRNFPSPSEANTICSIGCCYCILIVPSHYQMSFSDNNPSQNIRILENLRYNEYVKNVELFERKIKANAYIVAFKKISGNKLSFFSVFESEHVGMLSVLIAVVINILCTAMFFPWGSDDLGKTILGNLFKIFL